MNLGLDLRRGLELRHETIDRLPTSLKAALAAACAQRQAEVYRAYARRTGAGTSAAFDKLLNAIWDDIHHQQVSEPEHMEWHDRAERLHPSSQKTKRDIYSGCAELAVLSLLYSNSVLITGKAQDTIDAAHQTFISIFNFLVSPFGKKPVFDLNQRDVSEQVLVHPLTEAEHHRQEQDLFELEQALLRQETMPNAVDKVRRRAEIEAKVFLPIIG